MKKYLSITSLSRYIFSTAIILLGSLPLPVSAVVDPFYPSNDIHYYAPGGSGCGAVGISYSTNTDIPTLTGNDNAEKIWNFLKQDGMSDEQAAGIMGNLRQESNFNPDLTEGNGVGYGIVQWSFGRRNSLEKAAQDQGVPVSDLGFQLAFMKQEASDKPVGNWRNLLSNFGLSATDTVWDSMKKQTSIERATTLFHDSYEISGDYEAVGSIDHRIKFAEEAYEQFTGKSASSGSGGANCSAAGSGDLKAMTLEYAWPEYHDPPHLEMKPAYREAVDKAAADCQTTGGARCVNVGGGENPGIDCAGFVNLLILNSGFDTSYNNGGVGGRSDISPATGESMQRVWMEENWTFIGEGGSPEVDPALLQPGDVAVSKAELSATVQHIFIYVGEISGFNNVYASASYMIWRTPMAAADFETSANTDYVWYRKG